VPPVFGWAAEPGIIVTPSVTAVAAFGLVVGRAIFSFSQDLLFTTDTHISGENA
jgi:hypothetical protein